MSPELEAVFDKLKQAHALIPETKARVLIEQSIDVLSFVKEQA